MDSVREGLEQPGLAGLGAGARAEWREEQETAAVDAATVWQRSRSMRDWLVDRMHAGDRVAVTVGPVRFVGRVEEVGADLLGLRSEGHRVDVNLATVLPLAFAVVESQGRGGHRATLARNFAAAVGARDGTLVRIGALAEPEGRRGRLGIARDFVTVGVAGDAVVLPLGQVAWIAPVGRDD